MPRNRGQIPPYGEHFRRESTSYHPELASRVYVLKQDSRWFVRSDKTSKVWAIYFSDASGMTSGPELTMGAPLPSLTAAMAKLLDGIAQGFYQVNAVQETSR